MRSTGRLAAPLSVAVLMLSAVSSARAEKNEAAVPVPSLAVAASERPPSSGLAALKESVELAVRRGPRVKEALANWQAARQDVEQANGGLYPTIDVSSSTRRWPVGGGGASASPQATAITASYSVYDGGRIRGDIEQREHLAQAARDRLTLVTEEIAFKTAVEHLQVEKYFRMASIADESIASHEKIVQQVLDISQIDRGRQSDLVQAKARLERARANRALLVGKLREARQSYMRLAGRAPVRLSAEDLVGLRVDLPADALEGVIQSHPAQRAAEAEAEAARTAARIALASSSPQVNLEARATTERDAFNRKVGPNIGVALKWNAFRGFGDEAAQKAAAERSVAAAERSQETGMELREQILQSLEEIASLQDQVALLNSRSTQTDLVREAYREQFKIARRTLLDVLNAESEHFETRSSAVSTHFDFLIAQFRSFFARAALSRELGATPLDQHQQ